jgi:hypothetical protein
MMEKTYLDLNPPSRILMVFPADINKDGKLEIIAGSANWWVYAYDPAGKLLWSTVNWAHNPTCGAAADIDGDGQIEVMVGNDYGSVQIYRNDGKLMPGLGMTGHAGPSAMDAGDLNGNGRAEIVCGDLAGRLTFFEFKGRTLPSYELGTRITAVRSARMERSWATIASAPPPAPPPSSRPKARRPPSPSPAPTPASEPSPWDQGDRHLKCGHLECERVRPPNGSAGRRVGE